MKGGKKMFDFEYIKDIFKRNFLAIFGIAFGIISLAIGIGIVLLNDKNCEEYCSKELAYFPVENSREESIEIVEQKKTTVKVDIKGAVKKPGVYELNIGSTVNDAIGLAGGLSSSGVTSNINLSKKVFDEMVVYVFTKSELKELKSSNQVVCEIPKCECETIKIEECTTNNSTSNKTENPNASSSKKVSINNASLEELTALDGIGESKAKAIIEYRTANGPFKKVEDITNVSGIGASVYEKIKDNIEL